ncbi:hypothetical protein EHS39_13650 [Ensifer sp. MPMI2T]|nr:hypothetical protein EHS39_13650 [Ensifer sp. MPMI2T]
MSEAWNEQDTSAVVQAVAETRDPALAACAVIGGMIGVLVHHAGDDFTREVLGRMASLSLKPDAANTNRREGDAS